MAEWLERRRVGEDVGASLTVSHLVRWIGLGRALVVICSHRINARHPWPARPVNHILGPRRVAICELRVSATSRLVRCHRSHGPMRATSLNMVKFGFKKHWYAPHPAGALEAPAANLIDVVDSA